MLNFASPGVVGWLMPATLTAAAYVSTWTSATSSARTPPLQEFARGVDHSERVPTAQVGLQGGFLDEEFWPGGRLGNGPCRAVAHRLAHAGVALEHVGCAGASVHRCQRGKGPRLGRVPRVERLRGRAGPERLLQPRGQRGRDGQRGCQFLRVEVEDAAAGGGRS